MPRGRPVTRRCFAPARVGTTGSSHRRARAGPDGGAVVVPLPDRGGGPPAGRHRLAVQVHDLPARQEADPEHFAVDRPAPVRAGLKFCGAAGRRTAPTSGTRW